MRKFLSAAVAAAVLLTAGIAAAAEVEVKMLTQGRQRDVRV